MKTQSPSTSQPKKRSPKAVAVDKKDMARLVRRRKDFLFELDLAEAIGVGRMALRGLLKNGRCAPKTKELLLTFLNSKA